MLHYVIKLFIYNNTSTVLAVLLRGNSINAYISYQSLFPEAYYRPDHSMRIVECHRRKLLLSLNPTSSSGFEPGTVFRGCGLCFYNLLFETNNFGLGTVLLSFRATKTIFARTRTQDSFSALWPFCILFLVSRNRHPKFGANRFIRSRARNEHIYPQFQFYIFFF
jgi:hypothetical protein